MVHILSRRRCDRDCPRDLPRMALGYPFAVRCLDPNHMGSLMTKRDQLIELTKLQIRACDLMIRSLRLLPVRNAIDQGLDGDILRWRLEAQKVLERKQ